MGGKVDASVNQSKGPRTFRLSRQNYHKIGSLLPTEGSSPRSAQLYIYDTENEVDNRIQAISRGESNIQINAEIVNELKQMLDEHNVLAKLIGKRGFDGRRYNLPSVSEVAALVVGDFEPKMSDRDIIIESQSGQLKRINELNASYLGLQYPLLFLYGEDGYREDIPLNLKDESSGGRKCVSCREYFSYKIQERKHDDSTIVLSKRLFRQFLVDGLEKAVLRRDTEPSSQGQRVILSSSFTGGARYMLRNYQDAIKICKWAGYPDIFITFTWNSKWPEVTRFGKCRGLSPEDRPDILTRILKIKLDQLLRDLRDNNVFGEVKTVIYTTEFQKRGLPHAHFLLFLHNKCPNTANIDDIISAELPDNLVDPQYYATVTNLMIHGPCGTARKSSPCMQNVDDEGYPIYRRRDDGRSTKRAGHDRVTATFSQSENTDDSRVVDEINMHCDCRYISPCEAAWRIFKFSIHHREPSVERLPFHLDGNQNVIFSNDDSIDVVVNRSTVKESMFLKWFEANKEFPEARELTYAEFLLKIFFVPLGSGEQYYLRLLLNVIKGPTSYEDLTKINGHDHKNFRDACYALGLLDDDKEYVDAIVEAKVNLTDNDLENLCLQKIDHFIKGCRRSFLNFPTMPMPVYNEEEVDQNNRLIFDEMRYNR
ncbi:uncharacterized protein LOC107850864 [Capsicum annuum]|uniref:uncharacterized protein LOC107850864 n=1 Tax=Capsicum annuum TaxID=4072 RepID=UPI001FB0AD17|nr:uncharacterized protein LOC107850864 [Capsicum annuum]